MHLIPDFRPRTHMELQLCCGCSCGYGYAMPCRRRDQERTGRNALQSSATGQPVPLERAGLRVDSELQPALAWSWSGGPLVLWSLFAVFVVAISWPEPAMVFSPCYMPHRASGHPFFALLFSQPHLCSGRPLRGVRHVWECGKLTGLEQPWQWNPCNLLPHHLSPASTPLRCFPNPLTCQLLSFVKAEQSMQKFHRAINQFDPLSIGRQELPSLGSSSKGEAEADKQQAQAHTQTSSAHRSSEEDAQNRKR